MQASIFEYSERDDFLQLKGVRLARVEPAPYSALIGRSFKCYGHLRALFAKELRPYQIKGLPEQLSFDFSDSKDANIISFIPRHRLVYLNYPIETAFKDVPELVKFARRAEKNGLKYIGHIIQMDEAKVLALPLMTHELFDRMQSALARINFHFGMSLPRWNRANPNDQSR